MKKSMVLILTLFLGSTAHAQENQLRVIFETEPGLQLVSMSQDTLRPTILGGDTLDDADGDGIPDLIMTTKDAQGNLQDLLVVAVNEARPREIWRVDNVPATLGLEDPGLAFVGFANPFGGEVRHGIFVSDRTYLIDPRDNSLSWADDNGVPVVLRAVLDLTKDGYEDIIIYLLDTEQVQVWSIDQ